MTANPTYADLIARVAELEGTLRFYASNHNWRSCGIYMCGHANPSSAEIDRGDKARQALAGAK